MILKQGMKLTQIHSFNGMERLPDDFTKEGWCIEDLYSIRTVGTIYALHSKKIDGFINVDEEALKRFFTNWTSWKNYSIILEGKFKIIIQYRTNYRIVEVKYGQEKAKATCHKADRFSLNEGIRIAFERIVEKIQKHTSDKELKDKLAELMSSYKRSFDTKFENKKSQQKAEQKLIQINYMNQSILSVPAYHSIIHFTTYDEKVSKIFDEHFNLFDIKEGLAEERKWQKLTNNFLGNNEDCDIMATYGKNIITVFASEQTPIVKMSNSAQQKIAKALIKELIEYGITYIALWEQEINDDFVNMLIKEAQSKNKKLDISIAK